MTSYEIDNLIIEGLTFLVLTCTLFKLWQYTSDTQRLADAAVEAMTRPYIVIEQNADSGEAGILEGQAGSIDHSKTLRFKNVGSSTALNVRYKLETMSNQFAKHEGLPLAPGEVFASSWSRQALEDPARVIIEFQSLGGARYTTESLIDDHRWVRKVRFHRQAGADIVV
ncbi:MAG TPA: hypothetical protein VG206_26180 [Terriglobia bacterium]|nr:hypothetical protein [Terriglobia bacterium]